MVKKYSIAEAEGNLDDLVQEAEKGTKVELTRGGKPVAVLVGAGDFERMEKRKPSFREAYEKFRREHDFSDLDVAPEEIFGERDQSPGRDFDW